MSNFLLAIAISYAFSAVFSYLLSSEVQKHEDFPAEHVMTRAEMLVLSLTKPWTCFFYFGAFCLSFVRSRWG